jgi:hypothetical protein
MMIGGYMVVPISYCVGRVHRCVRVTGGQYGAIAASRVLALLSVASGVLTVLPSEQCPEHAVMSRVAPMATGIQEKHTHRRRCPYRRDGIRTQKKSTHRYGNLHTLAYLPMQSRSSIVCWWKSYDLYATAHAPRFTVDVPFREHSADPAQQRDTFPRVMGTTTRTPVIHRIDQNLETLWGVHGRCP